MSDFFTLIKYRLLNSTKGKAKRRSAQGRRMMVSILYFTITLAIFAVPLFPVMLGTFVDSASEYVLVGSRYVVLADAIFAAVTLLIMCLAFVNIIPFMIQSLFDEREICFLFSLPVKKHTILLYKVFDAFFSTFIVFSIYFPVFCAYGVARGGFSILLSVAAGLTASALAILIAMPVSALLSRRISRSSARKAGGLMILINVGVFVLIFILASTSEQAVGEISKTLLRAAASRYSPSTWVMRAARGELLDWLLLAVLSLWLWRIGSRVAEKMSLGGYAYSSSLSKTSTGDSSAYRRMTRFRKELYSVTRAENSLFFLMYPIVFGVIMMFLTREFMPAAIVMVLISSFYAAQLTVVSMAHEASCWPIQLAFPDSLKLALFRKIVVVGFLFTGVYTSGLLFGIVIIDLPILYLQTIITAFCTFFISAALGLRFYVTSGAFSSGVQRRRLSLRATLVLEILTFLISIGNIIVPVLLIDAIAGGTWLFFRADKVTSLIIGFGLPIMVSLVGVVFAIRSTGSIARRMIDGRM